MKRSGNRRETAGDQVSLFVTGGTLKIGKVTVEAGDLLRLPVKRRYLLFMEDEDLCGARRKSSHYGVLKTLGESGIC